MKGELAPYICSRSYTNFKRSDDLMKKVKQRKFHDGGPYNTETRPLICTPIQWTVFYMIGTPVRKELKLFLSKIVLYIW